jgi:hypothetical protein
VIRVPIQVLSHTQFQATISSVFGIQNHVLRIKKLLAWNPKTPCSEIINPCAKGFEIMGSKKLKGSYPHANGKFFGESKSMNFLVFYI